MSEFAKYQQLKECGASPAEVYRQALGDGVSRIEVVRLLRSVYGLDLVQAKEVIEVARGAESLEDAQRRLATGLEGAAKDS